MFTDTHCHLNRLDLEKYQGDITLALQSAKAANVHRLMAIMCGLGEYDTIFDIIDTPIAGLNMGMSVGVHPCESLEELNQATVETLVNMATPNHVWAIGETGLDYYWSEENKTAQRDSLARHIHASQILHKPLVVHTREAKHDTIDILRAEKAEHGIIHCFTEDYDTAKQALDLGFYISFSGIVTFKKAQALRDVALQVPIDRLLVETDSPYLAPVPMRGKSNEPAFVPYVANFMAELRGMTVEAFAQQVEQNFDNLQQQYSLPSY